MRLILSPNKAGATFLLIALAIFCGLGLYCRTLPADTLCNDVECIAIGIDYLMSAAPSRRLSKNPSAQNDLAGDILTAATKNNVPPLLVTVIAFRESSFRTSATGQIKEIGIMQVHGQAARGCNLNSQAGQLDCGARWLRKMYEHCGSWEGSVSAYLSGKCKPSTKRTSWLVKDRLLLWKKLEDLGQTREEI